jgi:3-dehydroquinate synthase
VVVQDERETGLRALLNFGHTFAHAIEAGVGYGQWLHGHAVACGMALAAELSQTLGWLGAQEVSRIKNIVLAMGCPLALPELSAERLLELMQVDKKAESGAIRFILLKALGQAIVYAPELAQVKQVLIQHALDDKARLNDSVQ